MEKKLTKIVMENYLSKKDYQIVKDKLQEIIGAPLCVGDSFQLKYNPIPRNIYQEVYHKKGSTIILEEEKPKYNRDIRANILITSDECPSDELIKNILKVHPYFQIDKNEKIDVGPWWLKKNE